MPDRSPALPHTFPVAPHSDAEFYAGSELQLLHHAAGGISLLPEHQRYFMTIRLGLIVHKSRSILICGLFIGPPSHAGVGYRAGWTQAQIERPALLNRRFKHQPMDTGVFDVVFGNQ